MSRPTTFSPAIIKHISRIASRGNIQFAKAFLDAQNYPDYFSIPIIKNLEVNADSGFKEKNIKKIPFSEKNRIYHPRNSYESKPRRFRNSISLS